GQTAGIEAGKELGLLIGHKQAVLAAAFSPDARSIVTGSADGTARVWDGTVEEQLVPIARSPRPLLATAPSGDGRFVVAGDAAGRGRVFSVGGRSPVASMSIASPVTDVAFAPDRRFVAAAAATGVLQIWNRDGHPVAWLAYGSPVVRARFSPHGTVLAAAAGSTVHLL